eukprot:scaffold62446_cov51-Phaeocystis_antarctica.AAC.4
MRALVVAGRCCQAPLAAEAFSQRPHLAPPGLDLALQLFDELVLRRDLPGLDLPDGGRARLDSARAVGVGKAHTSASSMGPVPTAASVARRVGSPLPRLVRDRC